MPEYTVTLKPVGVSVEDAEEIKEFQMELNEQDELEQQAKSRIVRQQLIDITSFRRHWEISDISKQSSERESSNTNCRDQMYYPPYFPSV